ncbi:integrase core domain-containing protein [Prevotella corporis]|uniref:integrase core domain-containing protein n=1 Tax=Prevotella corporis TaxID=28128 RepID=UPI002365FE51|nr:integrase core domain-containing protein [Prevotella corporis]
MTERYNPTDNPVAERTNGTFKVEWIYQQEMYRDYDQANMEISKAIALLQLQTTAYEHRNEMSDGCL